MEVRFYPKSGGKPGEKVSLQMFIQHHGTAKLGIGLSVYPEFWEKETQSVTKKHPNHKAVNDTIAQKRSAAEEIERQIRTVNGFATVEEIATEFKARTKPPKKEKKAVAPKVLPYDMASINERWKRNSRGFVADNTLRKYDQIVSKLNKYFPRLVAHEIDEAFIKKYLKTLAEEGLSKGTIAKHMEFLRVARESVNLPTKLKLLKVKTIYGPKPDMTLDELRKVINVSLDKDYLEYERDAFIFQMFVPLRDSHYRTLKPHHLQRIQVQDHGEIPVISTAQLKTEAPIVLPLPPLALAIWEKYQGVLPFVAQQRRNTYIKKICLAAGLTRGFVTRHHNMMGFDEIVKPLWSVCSTYTTRHTAASLMLEVTGDESLSGWLLGHTNHGIAGVTGVYAKKKAAKALPAILAAWEEIIGDAWIPDLAKPNAE